MINSVHTVTWVRGSFCGQVLAEAHNMKFVARHTTIPAPVFDSYTRDNITYIIMAYVPGGSLESTRPNLSSSEKGEIARSLGDLFGHPCILIFKRGGELIVVGVYVDDLLLGSKSGDALEWLKDQLIKEFNMKDLGEAKTIIGWEIT